MSNEPTMDLVDPAEILGMTFEVNEGPRWIDTVKTYDDSEED